MTFFFNAFVLKSVLHLVMFKISLYNIFVHKQYYLNYSATWEIKSSPVAIDGLPVLTAYISKVFI